MISVLIPIFNQSVVSLIREISDQLSKLRIDFEIIALDDGSDLRFHDLNAPIQDFSGVKYILQGYNIGRAAIRNRLAEMAQYENLIFLDCDSEIRNPAFIATYMSYVHSDVVYGGTHYEDKKNAPETNLHAKFGKLREALPAETRNENGWMTFKTNNFMIKKSILKALPFDVEITRYGYEDVVLAEGLKEKGIKITHIDNPVTHHGLETNERFLYKTEESLTNLVVLVNQGKIRDTRLLVFYNKVRWLMHAPGMDWVVLWATRRLRKIMISSGGNLWQFDLWKLMVYHQKTKSLPKIR